MTTSALRLPSAPAASRRLTVTAGTAAAALALYLLLGGTTATLGHALNRAVGAQPAWLGLAVAAEAVSIAGYVVLFTHVTGTGLGLGYRISLAGTAATRLLPTAGAGGVAFTVWALRRHTGSAAHAGTLVLRFLCVLYAVFLLGLLGAGVLAAAGGRTWALAPAAAAALAMAGAVAMARRGRDDEPLRVRLGRRAVELPRLGPQVREAGRLVREGNASLLGAVAWWAADAAVLALAFAAVGAAPAASVLLLVYFVGAVANTVPVPGAMSGGLVAVAVLCGVEPADAIAGVVLYRAVAMWLPTPFGAHALVRLRAGEA